MRRESPIWHFAFHQLPGRPSIWSPDTSANTSSSSIGCSSAGRRAWVPIVARLSRAYERPESLKAGFDWYRAMPADAKRNAEPKAIELPMLYLRGDADGRSPDEYARGIEAQGATRLTSQVVEGSGELMPLEVPEAFMRTLREFARHCAMALAA